MEKSYFGAGRSQNYIIFQPAFKHFKFFSGILDTIYVWNSNALSEKTMTFPTTLDNSFPPKLTYINKSKTLVKLERNCLKQDKVSFTDRNVVIFIVYELDTW